MAMLAFEPKPKGRQSKESGPGGPGFDFTPEGWSLPLDVEWNDGMVE